MFRSLFSFAFQKPAIQQIGDAIVQQLENTPLRVESFQIQSKTALLVLQVDPQEAPRAEPYRAQVEQFLLQQAGIEKANVILTAERAPSAPPALDLPFEGIGEKKKQTAFPELAKGVKWIIAVASGKGGVGKSTVASNLAVALSGLGLKTGLLDADIYGPSMPLMMGQSGAHPGPEASGKLQPVMAHGIRVMSIGFLVESEAPMIWRGPMVQSAIIQMLRDVDWSGLDVLVVDMPPGTGDAQLTLAQKLPLAGAVIVSTPQDVALVDARKGLNMFLAVNVPVMGIVENMSYFCCPNCGTRTEIFGHGGARADAERLGCPFLGEIPLALTIRTHADNGVPVVLAEPDSVYAEAYRAIARQVYDQLQARATPGGGDDAPTIRMID